MKNAIYSTFLALPLAFSSTIHQRDPGWQQIPDSAKAPNTFNYGDKLEPGQPPQTDTLLPDIYRAREIDLPFGRLLHGKVMYFKAGEMNTADGISDDGKVGEADYAKQSACGIPDNAYKNSKVAIHPYWLKYASLDRWCMQDVCICFRTDAGQDMISKVTDICSTDPTDPSHCASPEDIKLPRTKVAVIRGMTDEILMDNPELNGDADTQEMWWSPCKCLGEAIVQYAYKGPNTDNWFSTPEYPENNKDAVQVTYKQYLNNQQTYGAKNWTLYHNGVVPMPGTYQDKYAPITDWVPGQEPDWQPIAGGEGFGKPHGKDVNQLNGKYPNMGDGGVTNNGTITPTAGANAANANQDTHNLNGGTSPQSENNASKAENKSKPTSNGKATSAGTEGNAAAEVGSSTTPSSTPTSTPSITTPDNAVSDDDEECEL